jgi:hypothetical protein
VNNACIYLSGGNAKQENDGIDSVLNIADTENFSLPSIKENTLSEARDG